MGEIITDYGEEAGICGRSGTDWVKLLADALGHLQVDVVDSGGSDLGDVVSWLQALLVELTKKLDTSDINIESGSKDLQVDVKSSALPTGAATSDNQTTMITALQLIDDLRNALGSVNTDDLQVDVKSSALPTGAATSNNQTTMITALQLIDDLRNALGSVNTDDLQVDVKTSALPSGASTESTLAELSLRVGDEITPGVGAVNYRLAELLARLEVIDNLCNALTSVATDSLDARLDGQTADVEVTQTTPADLRVACHQYDGSTWRKSNLLWGFNDRYSENVSNTNLGAGTQTVWGTAVPTGYIYVVKAISACTVSSTVTDLRVGVYDGTNVCYTLTKTPPVSGQWYGEVCDVPMKAGDKAFAQVYTASVGDQLYFYVWGYAMRIM